MLSASEIAHFREKGWVLVDLFSPDEVAVLRGCLEDNGQLIEEAGGQKVMTFYNNVLGLETPRDLHLFHDPIMTMFRHSALIEKLRAVAGPDLLLWYTNVFCKMPGQGTIKWHQAVEYYTSSDIDFGNKTLVYDEAEGQLNLTVWVAIDDADRENGCMRFANRSQHRTFDIIPSALPAAEGVFAGISAHKTVWQRNQQYSIGYDFDERDWEVEDVPVASGQAIIFTERTMHCSYPNHSNRRRLGIIGRYVRPSTLVYPGRLTGAWIDENGHDIRRHFNVLVSGEDRYGHNVVRDRNDLDETELAFHRAYNRVRLGKVVVPEDQTQLDLVALEQQVLRGDNDEPQPNPVLHPRRFIHWQAWQQLRGTEPRAAMRRYSDLVARLADRPTDRMPASEAPPRRREAKSLGGIEAWLVAYIAEALDIPPGDIECDVPVNRYGLSSADTLRLMGDLGEWLGCDLETTLAYDHPTVASLASHLAGLTAAEAA
ncbi:MAG TPA: acyl-CoA-binding protein [Rhizomicrobium sp.]|nr:acyl-CoA-binding protein [Rhizomicrobium sp.]